MKKQSGFSLVELLVGMIISLLILLSIASSAKFINLQNSITLNSNNVLKNLSFAYYEVSNTIKSSGYGITECKSLSFSAGGVPKYIPLYSQAIIKSNDSGSDTITSSYGDSNTGGAYSFLIATISTSSNLVGYNINSGYSGHLSNGGLLLVSDAGNCGLAAISTVSYSDTNNTSNVGTGAVFNGVKIDLTSTDFVPNTTRITGLSNFKSITYSIIGDSLQEYDGVSGVTNKVADNIILLKAYYGLSDGSFVKADNSSGTDWSVAGLADNPNSSEAIRSIRVFMLARSPLITLKDSSGNCTTTAVMPVSWEGGPVIDLSADVNWKCYSYKKIDFVVALRNKILNRSAI